MNINKLRGKIVEQGLTVGELAVRIGVDRATLYRKIKDGSFSIKEACSIGIELKLTKNEVMEIFFSDYVA